MPAYIHIEKQEVIDLIRQRFTVKEIAEKLNIHRQTLIRKMRRWDLNQQKIKFNHNFFEKIDSEEKAYWLGFLFADGCVQIKNENNARISVLLAGKDKDQLIKFHNALNSIRSIEEIITNDKRLMVRSQHSSIKMAQDLIKIGCTPRKTHTCQFPNISENLYNHFIRGYFDGDGCAYVKHRKPFVLKTKRQRMRKFKENRTPSLELSICGTYNFLTTIKEILNLKIKLNFHTNIYVLSVGGNKQVKRVVDWLYKDATIYMERKYNLIFTHFRSLKERKYV